MTLSLQKQLYPALIEQCAHGSTEAACSLRSLLTRRPPQGRGAYRGGRELIATLYGYMYEITRWGLTYTPSAISTPTIYAGGASGNHYSALYCEWSR